jgi:hypothetical protein
MIDGFRFGEIIVNGVTYRNDVKILADGEVVHPWWRGSGHRVEPGDVRDIFREEPLLLILGKGDPGRMAASSALRRELEQHGIRLLEKPTGEAVDELNSARQRGERVCAGFHLTC